MLELILSVFIIGFGLAGLDEYENSYLATAKALNVGDYLASISNGALAYMTANQPALQAAIAAGGAGSMVTIGLDPASIEPNSLPNPVVGGFLPSTFVPVDGYGQTVELLVKQNPNNAAVLSGMVVTTGGLKIPDQINGQLINRIGVSGGFVPQNPVVAAQAGQVVGAYGGWATPATSWGSIPTAGRPAVTLDFGQAQDGLSNYLARYNMGTAEPNTMHTNIAMGQNSIANAQTVDTTNLTDVNGDYVGGTVTPTANGDICTGGTGVCPTTVQVGLTNGIDGTGANSIVSNEALDVSGPVSGMSGVQLYNATAVVWAPAGATLPLEAAISVWNQGGDSGDASESILLNGDLSEVISGRLTVAKTIESYGSVISWNQGDAGSVYNGVGYEQIGSLAPTITLWSNDGEDIVDSPSNNNGSYVNGASEHGGLRVWSTPSDFYGTNSKEMVSLGQDGVDIWKTTASSGGINMYGGGNIVLDTGSIIVGGTGMISAWQGDVKSNLGYVVSGGRVALGSTCSDVGAFAQNAADGNMLFCSFANYKWEPPGGN